MMPEVEAYLKQLAFWLPAKKRASITEEVRAVLLDRLDRAETAQEQPLTSSQIHQELLVFGRPAVIAGRFAQRRPVISAALAFFYWRVLRVAIAGVLVSQSIALLIRHLHGLGAGTADWTNVFARTIDAMIICFAVVTLVFIFLDQGLQRSTERREHRASVTR